jgi:hypothetical protein
MLLGIELARAVISAISPILRVLLSPTFLSSRISSAKRSFSAQGMPGVLTLALA